MSITAQVKFLTGLLLATCQANAMDSYRPSMPPFGQAPQYNQQSQAPFDANYVSAQWSKMRNEIPQEVTAWLEALRKTPGGNEAILFLWDNKSKWGAPMDAMQTISNRILGDTAEKIKKESPITARPSMPAFGQGPQYNPQPQAGFIDPSQLAAQWSKMRNELPGEVNSWLEGMSKAPGGDRAILALWDIVQSLGSPTDTFQIINRKAVERAAEKVKKENTHSLAPSMPSFNQGASYAPPPSYTGGGSYPSYGSAPYAPPPSHTGGEGYPSSSYGSASYAPPPSYSGGSYPSYGSSYSYRQ